MKKNLLLLSIFLSMGLFNDNNPISKKEVLSLIGRSAQTAMGIAALGVSTTGLYVLAAYTEESICDFYNETTAALITGLVALPATLSIPFISGMGLFGAWETYKGVKGLRKNIKKIKTNTKTHRE